MCAQVDTNKRKHLFEVAASISRNMRNMISCFTVDRTKSKVNEMKWMSLTKSQTLIFAAFIYISLHLFNKVSMRVLTG